MTRYRSLRRAYRDGSCLQSSQAPSLYEPMHGRLGPANPAVFAETQKRLTTFSMGLGVGNARRVREIVDPSSCGRVVSVPGMA